MPWLVNRNKRQRQCLQTDGEAAGPGAPPLPGLIAGGGAHARVCVCIRAPCMDSINSWYLIFAMWSLEEEEDEEEAAAPPREGGRGVCVCVHGDTHPQSSSSFFFTLHNQRRGSMAATGQSEAETVTSFPLNQLHRTNFFSGVCTCATVRRWVHVCPESVTREPSLNPDILT